MAQEVQGEDPTSAFLVLGLSPLLPLVIQACEWEEVKQLGHAEELEKVSLAVK